MPEATRVGVSVPEKILELVDELVLAGLYKSKADFYEKAGYRLLEHHGKLGVQPKEKVDPLVEE